MSFSLEGLNGPQRGAVTHGGEKHCLILAGAGSGKTRVLTYRIAWLVQAMGVDPSSILAITFTNKAAQEMRGRAQALLGGNSPVTLSTFHGFGLRFLKRYGAYAGLGENFSIYDESAQKALVKSILAQFGASDPVAEDERGGSSLVRDLVGAIAGYKESGRGVEAVEAEARTAAQILEARVYRAYEAGLRANNAIDFGDMLGRMLDVLVGHANVRERFQQQYHYILVDEFQDTNGLQLQVLRAMCGAQTKLTVVGDDDQSIYAWRGADASGILNFPSRFGACEVYTLEQNYRSTKPILACAATLIAHNRVRNEKCLWTSVEGGEPVRCIEYASDREEGSGVVDEIIAMRRRLGLDWGQFAILFRRNSQSAEFEKACTRRAVPYQVVKGTGFFEREEIADLMAYLRFLVNPLDKVSLRRIINRPVRGIGEKSAETLLSLAETKTQFGVAPQACFRRLLEDIVAGRCSVPRGGAKFAEGCRQLLCLLEQTDNWPNQSPRETLETILDVTQYMAHVEKSVQRKDMVFEDARERIWTLSRMLNDFQQEHPNDLPRFLEEMALVRPEADASLDAVKMMTIHGAKGLEFEVVFVAGVEDKVLPLAHGGICDVEEERRLMYVAMTRARQQLYLTHATRRWAFRAAIEAEPSPFLDEMQPEEPSYLIRMVVEGEEDRSYGQRQQLAWSGQKRRDALRIVPRSEYEPFEEETPTTFSKRHTQASDEVYRTDDHRNAAPPPPWMASSGGSPKREKEGAKRRNPVSADGKTLEIGSRVVHSVHGTGIVTALSPSGNDFKAEVDFAQSGTRTIISKFLKRL